MDEMAIQDQKLDQIFTRIGGVSCFHIFLFFAINAGMSTMFFIPFSMGFLTQEPVYKCAFSTDEPHDPAKVCTVENICADDKRIVNFEPDYSNANSLDNWVMRLNLTCASKFHKGALGSAFFFGWVLTLLWMPRLGDILGRSLLYRITVFVDLLMFLAVFFIKRWVPMIVVLTVIGAFTSIRYNIGYVYLLEFFPKESRPIVGSCQGILRGLIALALALYFWKINKNWIFIMAFAWLL